jgi:S1-C subfamily serine protease
MLAQVGSVHIHVRDQESAVELEKEVASGIAVVHRVVTPIPADAAIIRRGRPILSVGNVPRVRQVHTGPGGIIETGCLGS